MSRFTRYSVCLIWFLASNFAQAYGFSISASVDSNEVGFGDSFNLTITITQETSGFSSPRYDISGLSSIPGFDIVNKQSAQNITVINGVGQISLQTIYELVPQKPGKHKIPPFTVKTPDGKTTSTDEIEITVLPPAEEKTPESAAAEPEKSSGIPFLRGLIWAGLILGTAVLIPVLISVIMRRKGGATKLRSMEAAHGQSMKPPHPGSDVEDAAVIVSENTDRRYAPGDIEINFDFEQEVEKIKRLFSETGLDFYRTFFDLFRQALIRCNRAIQPEMTPDEIIKALRQTLPQHFSDRLARISNEWDQVAFAHMKPSRSFSDIYNDAVTLISANPLQER